MLELANKRELELRFEEAKDRAYQKDEEILALHESVDGARTL